MPRFGALPTGPVLAIDQVDLDQANRDVSLLRLAANTLGLVTTGGFTIGLAAGAPAPDGGAVHIWAATAGVVAAPGNTFLVLENSASARIAFLTPNDVNAGLIMGDPEDNDAGRFLYEHSIDGWDTIMDGVHRLRYTAGAFAFQEATVIDIQGGYLQLTERAAPAAGGADTVRIYAVEGGGALTDLAAIFQTGVAQIFAQEPTDPRDAVVAAAHGAIATLAIDRPHPGRVRLIARVPELGDWVITEYQFHDAEKISWVKGAVAPLPSDWVVETAAERAARVAAEAEAEVVLEEPPDESGQEWERSE